MKGTTSFKKLPESQKRCQVHNRENCQTNNFLGQVLTQCECVPWDLMDGTTLEKVNLSFNDFTLSPQVNTFCSPRKEICVANQTLKDKSCLVPCTGLYADIEDDSRFQINRQHTAAVEQKIIKGIF